MKKIWKQRYQVMEERGKGGNGRVYKVWDLHLEKEWAMKILEERNMEYSKEILEKEEITELQVLKRITHPNFPRIVDAFEEDGYKVLIMDFVYGVNLQEIIERGAVEEEKILLIGEQIAEALLYLHQYHPVLLYLDLKPSNIIVEENGRVKLIDLGSVRIKGSRGAVSGSYGFASPEQKKVQKVGSALTEQSDVFSFGLVLYTMAVGNCRRLPVIEEGDKYGVFVRKDNFAISRELEKIIEECTRGNPDRRYTGMREVMQALENRRKNLKRKMKHININLMGWKQQKEQWYLEKSILCTEGKHSFYIAKKVLLILLGVSCLLSGKVSRAWGVSPIMKGTEEVVEGTVTETGNCNEKHEKEKTGEKKDGYESEGIGEKRGDYESLGVDENIESHEEAGIDEKREKCEKIENKATTDLEKEKNKNEERDEMGIIIRDCEFRKVLVKEGEMYENNKNLILEIPWEEIEGTQYRLLVECEDESREKKRFYIDCVYAK